MYLVNFEEELMAKKKSKVTSILLSNVPAFAATYFCVGSSPLNAAGEVCVVPGTADGEEPVPAFPPVKKIIFCRHAFGQGAQVDQPCYAVSFEDAPESLIIRSDAFCQVTIAVEQADDTPVPNLPE